MERERAKERGRAIEREGEGVMSLLKKVQGPCVCVSEKEKRERERERGRERGRELRHCSNSTSAL